MARSPLSAGTKRRRHHARAFTNLEMNRENIREAFYARVSPSLLGRLAPLATVLALVRLDVLPIQALAERQGLRIPLPLGRRRLQPETQVEEGLDGVRGAVALLADGGGEYLAVEDLVDDALAAVLAARLGAPAVAVALVELFGEELEELVGVLLLCGDEVLKGLLLRDPESRQDVRGRVTVSILDGVEVLEDVVQGAAQAVLGVAVCVAVAEVKVPEEGVVEEALQYDVLVAGGACVVDAA